MFSFTFSKYSNINLMIQFCSVFYVFLLLLSFSMTISALWMTAQSVHTATTSVRSVSYFEKCNKLKTIPLFIHLQEYLCHQVPSVVRALSSRSENIVERTENTTFRYGLYHFKVCTPTSVLHIEHFNQSQPHFFIKTICGELKIFIN